MAFDDALGYDRTALGLLAADVAAVPDEAMDLPTPCSGWAVRDLVHHMNAEHVAICDGSLDRAADPREQFGRIAKRWLAFFEERRDQTVWVPKVAADLPSERILSVHFADMLVHRWDLAVSLGASPHTEPHLIDVAFSVARVVTAPGSPVVGDDGVYRAALPPDERATALENLVRMYGRDHRFVGPTSSSTQKEP